MKSQTQVNIITQYLEIETNYAVIISGVYGVGKTHFFKHHLSPEIERVPLPNDSRKNFTPVHVSLFGLKSIEELQAEIFLTLYPILKSKKVTLALGLGKTIARGIAQVNRVGDIDKYIGDLTKVTSNSLSFDELVICLDDLDRKSDLLKLKDVFGFINSLVENQGAKILIIANEERLLNDQEYTSELREKVIGVSMQFTPAPEQVYDQIIKKYAAGNQVYFSFLEEKKKSIVAAIRKNENNFRNLIFFLEHFKVVFYPIVNLFETDEDFAGRQDEKLKAILHFTLAVSIEYKLGLLNSTNQEELLKINSFELGSIENILSSPTEQDKQEEAKPSYSQKLNEKYFSENKYYFFKSIFDYITGQQAFDEQQLKAELEEYFIVEQGIMPRQEELLQQLSYSECFELSTQQYKKFTAEMLTYVDRGLYQLTQYTSVFHYATRFGNLLNYDINRLKKRFMRGIDKGTQHYSYTEYLEHYLTVGSTAEFKDDMVEIAKYCIAVNGSIKEAEEQQQIQELAEMMGSNFKGFLEKVREPNSLYSFSPFWGGIGAKKTVRILKKLRNDQIWSLGYYFRSRYKRNIYSGIYAEKPFVTELRELINVPTKERQRKTLKNVALNFLSGVLKEGEANFI